MHRVIKTGSKTAQSQNLLITAIRLPRHELLISAVKTHGTKNRLTKEQNCKPTPSQQQYAELNNPIPIQGL